MFSAGEWILLLGALGVFFSSLFTGVVSVITARRVGQKIAETSEKVDQVGQQLDGRLTQWKDETSKFVDMAIERARAQGRTEGREDVKSAAAALVISAEHKAEGVIETARVEAQGVLKTAEEKTK